MQTNGKKAVILSIHLTSENLSKILSFRRYNRDFLLNSYFSWVKLQPRSLDHPLRTQLYFTYIWTYTSRLFWFAWNVGNITAGGGLLLRWDTLVKPSPGSYRCCNCHYVLFIPRNNCVLIRFGYVDDMACLATILCAIYRSEPEICDNSQRIGESRSKGLGVTN